MKNDAEWGPVPRKLSERYLRWLLDHRRGVVASVVLATAFLGYGVARLEVYTDFFDLYPPRHPYIRLYEQYRKMFGTANVLVVIVERSDGTIFDRVTLGKIDRVTRYLMETPGVDPNQVISLTHPRLKDVRITSWGIEIRPVVWSLEVSESDLRDIRETVYTNQGVRGFYVSPDDTAATVFAGFWEEGTDLTKLYGRMHALEQAENDAHHRIYVTGYPMLFAWVMHYMPYMAAVGAATLGVLVALLWFYFHSWEGVWVPILSGGLSSVWALGFAGLCGLNLDPLSIVAFVLITARALSHSVQSLERYHTEYARLGDQRAAVAASYRALFPPAMVSIAADGLAILTLATASIPLIQKLAFVSSFWIVTISVSVVTLHPILLAWLSPPRPDSLAGRRLSDRFYAAVNAGLVRIAVGNARFAVVAVLVATLLTSLHFGRFLKVGDVTIGKAFLSADHPYNQAFDFLNAKFVGSAQLVVVAEGGEPGAIQDNAVLEKLERFQRHMEADPETGGSITITNLVKRVNRMFHESEPRWELLPRLKVHLQQIFFQLEVSSAPGELARFFSPGYQNATITVFYRQYSNDAIKRARARAREFIEANPLDEVRFRLAGGLMGVLAAVQEEVEWSYGVNLYLVLGVVFVLSFITYRSVVGALIVMVPSIVAQPATEAAMYLFSIDMNINSLPVAAIGIGIGIDYGYYVLSRIIEELEKTGDFDAANRRALESTGRAIVFTGTSLVASVVFWIWFPLKFQADMAFLLMLVLALHVVGALVFIPALISLVRPRFVRELASLDAEGGDGERLASEGVARGR